MKRMLLPCAVAATMALTTPGAAQSCYADYKAKQDNPLKLHYGVAELSGGCAKGAAQTELAPRLKSKGWTLLNVVSVFGPDGLEQRKTNAGAFFLRF